MAFAPSTPWDQLLFPAHVGNVPAILKPRCRERIDSLKLELRRPNLTNDCLIKALRRKGRRALDPGESTSVSKREALRRPAQRPRQANWADAGCGGGIEARASGHGPSREKESHPDTGSCHT